MQFVPWQHIANWKCTACGNCCRLYSVVLNFQEWLRIVKNFGVESTSSGLERLSIKRGNDGSCTFLWQSPNYCLCRLQHMKPKACQLWPFKVLTAPEFGEPNRAVYHCGQQDVFIYADPMCHGLKFGTPTLEFTHSTLKEFVQIAAGLRSAQLKTTSNIGFWRQMW